MPRWNKRRKNGFLAFDPNEHRFARATAEQNAWVISELGLALSRYMNILRDQERDEDTETQIGISVAMHKQIKDFFVYVGDSAALRTYRRKIGRTFEDRGEFFIEMSEDLLTFVHSSLVAELPTAMRILRLDVNDIAQVDGWDLNTMQKVGEER